MSLPAVDTRSSADRQGVRRAKEAAMTIVRTASLFTSLALVLSISACNDKRPDVVRDTQPAPADAPPALATAHEAYLAGDWVEMGERLKEVLVDPRSGELARDNAFSLLESAYEATHGQLPARATLPPSVSTMTLGVLNGATAFGPHRMVFLFARMTEGRAAHVTDIRVTRLPSEPILGLREKRGVYVVEHTMPGFDDIKLEARNLDVLPDRGAFSIRVEFDDGPGLDAFVLANKLVASAPPEVTSPAVGQVVKDPHPEIAWIPYRSSELASWETRALNVGVSGDGAPQSAWSVYKRSPGELSSVRVGEAGTPSAALEPGSYWMDLMYSEERRFGAIWISRGTNSARPFSVVR